MAITKTRSALYVRVDYSMAEGPYISYGYHDVWDDPDDQDLPVTKRGESNYYTLEDTESADQIVKDIAAVIWSD